MGLNSAAKPNPSITLIRVAIPGIFTIPIQSDILLEIIPSTLSRRYEIL
jgi:hypothetical protein